MKLSEFQKDCERTVFLSANTQRDRMLLCALGLAGEASEFLEDVRSAGRDSEWEDWRVQRTVKELGDVMWYFCVLATTMDKSVEDLSKTSPVQVSLLSRLDAAITLSIHAGRLVEYLKKHLFSQKPWDDKVFLVEIRMLWCAIICASNAIGIPLEHIMQTNQEKLAERYS